MRSIRERLSVTDAPAQDLLLRIDDLSVSFDTGASEVRAVRNVSFEIGRSETLALVGESGSGKSVSALSILQLLPYPTAHHPSGSIKFSGEELIGAASTRMQQIRGNRIAIIFQEPLTSLNPLHTIEKQIGEILFVHKKLDKDSARVRIIELLTEVGLPNVEERLSAPCECGHAALGPRGCQRFSGSGKSLVKPFSGRVCGKVDKRFLGTIETIPL